MPFMFGETTGLEGRFIHWKEYEIRRNGIEVVFSIFALERKSVEYELPAEIPALCSAPSDEERQVWLWPKRARIRRTREEMEQICDELSRMKPIVSRSIQLQQVKKTLTSLHRLEQNTPTFPR